MTVIYPGWIYGPGDHAFFPSLAQAIADGFMLFWYRGARLPWVYIDNFVDACILAAHPAPPGTATSCTTAAGPTLRRCAPRSLAPSGRVRRGDHVPYAAALRRSRRRVQWDLARSRACAAHRPLLTVDVKAFGPPAFRLSNEKICALGWAAARAGPKRAWSALWRFSSRRASERLGRSPGYGRTS